MLLSHYELLEKLAEAPRATIYQTYHRQNPHRRLVFKVLKLGMTEGKKPYVHQKSER